MLHAHARRRGQPAKLGQLEIGRRRRLVGSLQWPVDADLEELREACSTAHWIGRPRVVRDDER
jgi:hypothetical protein